MLRRSFSNCTGGMLIGSPLPFGGSHATTNPAVHTVAVGWKVTTAFRRFACCDPHCSTKASSIASRSPLPFGGSHAATSPDGYTVVDPWGSPLPFGGSHAATFPFSATTIGTSQVTTAFRRFACRDPFWDETQLTGKGHHCLSAVRMLRRKPYRPVCVLHSVTTAFRRFACCDSDVLWWGVAGWIVTTAFRRFACCDE